MLENRVNNEILKERLLKEPFKRRTISFYRYVKVLDPVEFRDRLYVEWSTMKCFGRIYIAYEGINAQMSVPEYNLDAFTEHLNSITELAGVPVKYAIEDNGKSFFKLTMRVRPKIVADGLDDEQYDFSRVGKHLSAIEFHDLVDREGTVVIDMRNHYESEVGRFKNAICPQVETFKESIQLVLNEFEQHKEKKILLYCTGGIRCEKASSFLISNGFMDVSQLYGGIIEYAQQIKRAGIPSKFTGKNFVFDDPTGRVD